MGRGTVGWLAAALAVACAGPEAADGPYRAEERPDGSVLVRDAPLAEVPRWTMRELWSAESDEWSEPSRVSIADGRVALLDAGVTKVHLLDLSTGRMLPSLGREGDGPGEWPRLSGATLVGDALLVSARPGVLTVHDLGGRELRRLEHDFGTVSLTRAGPDRALALTRTGQPRAYRVSLDPPAIDGPLPLPPDDRYDEETYGSCAHLAATTDGMARLRCSAGRLELPSPVGDTGWIAVEWPEDPRPSTEEELDGYIARFWETRSGGRPLSGIVERQLQGVRDGARIRPVYADLQADPAGGGFVVVEQPFGEYGPGPGALHFLDPTGRHQGIVQTEHLLRDIAVLGDTVALLLRDPATDVVELRVAVLER